MENNRNNHIKLEDFLMLWSQAVGLNTKPTTMKKYLGAFQKVILDELKLNGEIYVHNFGSFRLRQIGGDSKMLHDYQTGEMVHRFCKQKLQISFFPSSVFKSAVNENDFVMPKKKSKRKYSTKQYKVVRSEKRRKPKKEIEDALCDLLNESEKKVNGKGNTDS